MVGGQVAEAIEETPQLGLRRLAVLVGLADEFVQQVDLGEECLHQDLVFAGEVAVNRGPGQTHRGSDLFDADVAVPGFLEECRRRPDDLLGPRAAGGWNDRPSTRKPIPDPTAVTT